MADAKPAHRISVLPLAELCPAAPSLSEKYGSGRAAAVSNAYHARVGGQPDADAKAAALTDEEREELDSWALPPPVESLPGLADLDVAFYPATATCEEEVVLRHSNGSVSIGHVDMYEVYNLSYDTTTTLNKVVVVVDTKRSLFTTGAYPSSLQLSGYGLALCDKHGADAWMPGIWAAQEGEYRWGELVEVDSPRGYELRERAEYAATHEGEASMGPHCSDCFSAHHCREYLLPAAVGEVNPDLVALTKGDFTEEEAVRALQAVKAMEKIAKEAIPRLKRYAATHGGLRDEGAGKMWIGNETAGRESVASVKRVKQLVEEGQLTEAQGALLISKSPPIIRYVWRNIK